MESTGDRERVVLNGGKHVMLSYNWNSQDIVSQIYKILKDENIPMWFDIQGDMKQNIYDSMAHGIENAAVVCCFMTPDYQTSENCKLELQYGKKRGKRIIPCMLGDKSWKPSGWLGLITAGEQYVNLRDTSSENILIKTRELINRIRDEPSTVQSLDEPSYLFELIKLEYKRNNRIDQIMNPSKSFSIDQSYINLAIVEVKEQQEQEKKLRIAQTDDTIIGTFEQIYGMKTVIDLKDIFNKCPDQTKNILVLGRAGIGKSTFCQYVAYRWATGTLWSQYDLLIVFTLRSLTEIRYPPLSSGTNYSLIDLVKKEYFGNELSDNDDRLLREQFSRSKVLWILDGYDEIVQNVPEHLRYLFEQLLKTSHHIVTSRPYLNKLSYAVQLEITGFTDDNIVEYVSHFFDRIYVEHKLIHFLKSNPSIWGVAHIPINLELICSIWSDTDWSETKSLTITALYDCMTEWILRRYLTKQNADIQMTKDDLYIDCQKELIFLETLAFRGMEKNTIILRKELLQKTLKETNYPSKDYTRLLNIGILKSMNDKSIGNQIEVQKDHYFIHLSFQEHFAARYLIRALTSSDCQVAIDFIKTHKYNQRFQLMLAFTSGLVVETDSASAIDVFWDAIVEEPVDLIGLRHLQLIMYCMEECIGSSSNFRRRTELMNAITNGIIVAVCMKYKTIYHQLLEALRKSSSLVNNLAIQDTLTKLLQIEELAVKKEVLSLIVELSIVNPAPQLIQSLLVYLCDAEWSIRMTACQALQALGDKAAVDDVLNKLLIVLDDENASVRASACDALGKISGGAVNESILNKLSAALEDKSEYVRRKACEAFGQLGEQINSNNVISKVIKSLEDKSAEVRWRACEVIGKIGEKAAVDITIKSLVTALGDDDGNVRRKAREALGKMGDKITSKMVMDLLLLGLEDPNELIKQRACVALSDMGIEAATTDAINELTKLLQDENAVVRENACKALGQMGKEVVRNHVIENLLTALQDVNGNVRWQACLALMRMDGKAPILEIIHGLLSVLRHEHWNIRQNACKVLGEIGDQAVLPDVINGLVNALGDEYGNVQEMACKVLGLMGQKIATDEMITGLITALGNVWSDVRESAWIALEKMNGKITINEIINRTLIALSNDKMSVRSTGCRALGQIGEKVLTDEIINGLLTALNDSYAYVRKAACEALEQIGGKVATNDVVNKLGTLLTDADAEVRCRACQTLGVMVETFATENIIVGLMAATKDENWTVSMAACTALSKLGTQTTDGIVINTLVAALGNNMGHVRRTACKALGKIGQKGRSKEVIDGLVIALSDQDMSVREEACKVLEHIVEQVPTNEVVQGLINARSRVYGCSAADQSLEKICLIFPALTQFSSDTLLKLNESLEKDKVCMSRAVPENQFAKVFLHTKNSAWLPVITINALQQGHAITMTDGKMTIYGHQEPIEIIISDGELRNVLYDGFIKQKEKLELSSSLVAQSTPVSSVCVLM